jgi:hypothetical protein
MPINSSLQNLLNTYNTQAGTDAYNALVQALD